MEPHALICKSSDVREVEPLKLQSVYGLISLAGQSPHGKDKANKDDQF